MRRQVILEPDRVAAEVAALDRIGLRWRRVRNDAMKTNDWIEGLTIIGRLPATQQPTAPNARGLYYIKQHKSPKYQVVYKYTKHWSPQCPAPDFRKMQPHAQQKAVANQRSLQPLFGAEWNIRPLAS